MFPFESNFQEEMQLCFHSASVWISRFIKPRNPARVCIQQGQDDPSRSDLTFVAPGLHRKLDLILRQSSWRWNCPKLLAIQTTNAWELKGKAVFLAVCCLGSGSAPSAFWSHGDMDYAADADMPLWVYKTSWVPMLYQKNCNQWMFQLCSIWKAFFSPSSL